MTLFRPPVWCEVQCESCAMSVAGAWVNGTRIPHASLRAEVRRLGHTVEGSGRLLCATCAREAVDSPDKSCIIAPPHGTGLWP